MGLSDTGKQAAAFLNKTQNLPRYELYTTDELKEGFKKLSAYVEKNPNNQEAAKRLQAVLEQIEYRESSSNSINQIL